jgi:hypothetical protein
MRVGLVVAILSVAVSLPLEAQDVFVALLPGLQGTYSTGETLERTTVVSLPSAPALAYAPTIELRGSATLLGPVDFSATIPDPGTGGWWGSEARINGSGLFQITSTFTSHNGATWDFLNSHPMQITLRANFLPGVTGRSTLGQNPEVTVQGAQFTLVVDGRLPVQSTSWGQVKALFE